MATEELGVAGTPWDGGNTAPSDGSTGQGGGICRNSLTCTANICVTALNYTFIRNKSASVNKVMRRLPG